MPCVSNQIFFQCNIPVYYFRKGQDKMLEAPVLEKAKVWMISESMMIGIYSSRPWYIVEDIPKSPQNVQSVPETPTAEPPPVKKEPRVSTFWLRKLGKKGEMGMVLRGISYYISQGLRQEVDAVFVEVPPVEITLPTPDVSGAGWEPAIMSLDEGCPDKEMLREINIAIAEGSTWVERDPMHKDRLKALKEHILRVGVHKHGGKMGRPLPRVNAMFAGFSIEGGTVTTKSTGNYVMEGEDYLASCMVKHKGVLERAALVKFLADIHFVS